MDIPPGNYYLREVPTENWVPTTNPGGQTALFPIDCTGTNNKKGSVWFGNIYQEPVLVPEFPTIAVSVLVITGMVAAVQFMKRKENQ